MKGLGMWNSTLIFLSSFVNLVYTVKRMNECCYLTKKHISFSNYLAFAYDPDGYAIEIIKRGGIEFGDSRAKSD